MLPINDVCFHWVRGLGIVSVPIKPEIRDYLADETLNFAELPIGLWHERWDFLGEEIEPPPGRKEIHLARWQEYTKTRQTEERMALEASRQQWKKSCPYLST